jgi:Flp pilus assembly protein TadG
MALRRLIRDLGTTLARLRREEDGAIVVMVVIGVALFIGIGGLAIDIGRLYNLHTQLQAYADHVSLAAAAELDGEAGAIERAARAAFGDAALAAPIAYQASFVFGNANLSTAQLTFLSRLGTDPGPAGDQELCTITADGTSDCTAAHSNAARFVRAVVEPRTVRFFMLPIMRMFDQPVLAQATTEAVAVAGFTRQVCNFPPLMICNPYENPNPPYGGDFTPIIGQQILAKGKGPGTQWAPGDFGLLQAAANSGQPYCSGGGANRIRCVMALVEPNTQCVGGTVDIMPGQAVSVHEGLNVRFDMWNPPISSERTNPAFAPSANVTKGARWTGNNPNQCQFPQHFDPAQAQLMGLPRDSCFGNGSCARFGNAEWDRDAYWAANHEPLGRPKPAGYQTMTRYDVYRYELDNSWVPNLWGAGGENGNPQCAPSSINNPIRDRRTLIAAVINCREHGIQGSATNVPVLAFAQMFFTEPVGMDGSNTDDIWLEMLGVVDPGGDDGVLHDFPQLYR